MASTMIGIQITGHRLTLVALHAGTVTARASARIPQGLVENGHVTDLPAMAELIRDTLAARNIRSRNCALVLPKGLVLSRQLKLPAMGAAELKLNLPYEFRDMATRPLTDYDFDYIVLSASETELELWAAALPRDAGEEYRQLLKLAGLRLEIAIPAEFAWSNYLNAREDLPDPIGILQQERNAFRLDIFSGGRFVTGKEFPKGEGPIADADAQALRRALNLYNFSLVPGSRPVENLVVPEDLPEPERELLASVTGMHVHPGSLLPGGAAAGAAIQTQSKSSARKQTLNLIRPVKPFDARKMLPLVAILAAALLAFAKFGILDPLEEKARAYNDLSARQAQQEQANRRLGEYDAVFQDYIRFGTAQLLPAETELVSRSQILSLAESTIAPRAKIDSLTVNGNILTVNLSGITLEAAGDLVSRLEADPMVSQAGILSATASDGNTANILLTVTLEKEAAHE